MRAFFASLGSWGWVVGLLIVVFIIWLGNTAHLWTVHFQFGF